MMLSDRQKKVIDVIQWLLIVFLLGLCLSIFMGNISLRKEKKLAREETFIKIYDSQKIADLEKKNKELYDSLTSYKKRNDGMEPESALVIEYQYTMSTDTLAADKFTQDEDSVYHFVEDNDTMRTEVNIKAKELEWCTASMSVNDRFMIINRTDGDKVETSVSHSGNVNIKDVTGWHKKRTLADRIYYGPSVSAGYNPFTGQVEFLVGVSVGLDMRKR